MTSNRLRNVNLSAVFTHLLSQSYRLHGWDGTLYFILTQFFILAASMEQHKQQSSNQTPPTGGRVGSRHLPAGGGDRFSQSMSEKRGRNMQGIHILLIPTT